MATAVVKKNKKIFTWAIGIMIGLIVASIGTYYIIKFIRKRREERELEESAIAANIAPPKQPIGYNTNNSSSAPSSPSAPSSSATSQPASNDNFPLKKGSQGERVKYLQMFINKIAKTSIPTNGIFDTNTYNTLITKISTKYYPVTQDFWLELADKANKS